jgi:hypothetical protein
LKISSGRVEVEERQEGKQKGEGREREGRESETRVRAFLETELAVGKAKTNLKELGELLLVGLEGHGRAGKGAGGFGGKTPLFLQLLLFFFEFGLVGYLVPEGFDEGGESGGQIGNGSWWGVSTGERGLSEILDQNSKISAEISPEISSGS